MTDRRGRWDEVEKRFVEANGAMSPEEMAKHLGRSLKAVRMYLDRLGKKEKQDPVAETDVAKQGIRQELRNSEKWQRLREELTETEIRFFEEEYAELMLQFEGNVLYTEITQVFDCIKIDLLKSRNMIERRKAREDIARLEKEREALGAYTKLREQEKAYALGLENQISVAREAEQERTNEYVKLQQRHDALMKGLKATRDQRVQQVESSKVSFLGLIKMLQERDQQEQKGRQMELMRLATDKEYERLGRPIRYEDGNMDNPILSADTVDLGPEETG